MATNPAVLGVSKDCFVRYFVEVPKLADVPLGYGLQPKCDYVKDPPAGSLPPHPKEGPEISSEPNEECI